MIDDVRNKLGVRLGLIPTAHDAKGDSQLPFGHESGNNGMERALATGEYIWTVRFESEKCTAILEGKSSASGDDARTEGIVIALDVRNHVAFGIDNAEISCVRSDWRRSSCWHITVGFLKIDQFGSFTPVIFGKQTGDGNAIEIGIADVLEHVGVGEVFSLNHYMVRA